jgi:HSP20 family protein
MSTTLTKPERTVPRPWFRRGGLDTLREDLQDMFSQFVGDGNLLPWAGYAPSLDLSETDTTLDVRMDVPGVKPDDIDVQLSGNLLTIRGKRSEEKEEKGRTFHRVERSYGSFSRSVTLPCDVKEDKVDAQIHDGILRVTLQKSEEAKTRKIKVRS